MKVHHTKHHPVKVMGQVIPYPVRNKSGKIKKKRKNSQEILRKRDLS